MNKKITSVIKFDNNLKIGTTDKKNPKVIYFEWGYYIRPKIKKEQYFQDIESVKKELADFLKNYMKNATALKKDYLFFTEIAEDRIFYNKKSFFTFQLLMKPNDFIVDHYGFKEIAEAFSESQTLVSDFKKIIRKYDFAVCKSKS